MAGRAVTWRTCSEKNTLPPSTISASSARSTCSRGSEHASRHAAALVTTKHSESLLHPLNSAWTDLGLLSRGCDRILVHAPCGHVCVRCDRFARLWAVSRACTKQGLWWLGGRRQHRALVRHLAQHIAEHCEIVPANPATRTQRDSASHASARARRGRSGAHANFVVEDSTSTGTRTSGRPCQDGGTLESK